MCIFGSKIAVCGLAQAPEGQGDTAQSNSVGVPPRTECIHHTPDNLDMVTSKRHLRLRQKRNFYRK